MSYYRKPKYRRVWLKKGKILDRYFPKRELVIGMRIEKEHTNNPYLAEQIAKAHLKERNDYYKTSLFKKERIKAKKYRFKYYKP